MRYWLMTTEYPPFVGGGIGTYCAATAAMFADAGHDVSVFVNDSTVRDLEITTEQSIRIIRFNPDRTRASGYLGHVTNISYAFAQVIREFIAKESKPDLLEAQEYLGIAYYLLQHRYLLSDWIIGVPVILTVHSPSFLYLEYNHVPLHEYPVYWICEMERFCLRAADHLISPSRYIMVEIEKRFRLSDRPVTVIPNPVNLFVSGTDRIIPNRPITEMFFYGKLSRQKGSFHLLAALEKMWAHGFAGKLTMIGGQDIVYHPEGLMMGDILRAKYRHRVREGLLVFEDRIPASGIVARFRDVELVIIPSYHDNLPYVVFEMMALGKIVLVSAQGGQAEVVEDNIDGFVFDHDVPGSLEKKLVQVMALDVHDRERISRAAALKVAGNFSTAVIYPAKLALLQSVIAGYSTPSAYPFVHAVAAVAAKNPGYFVPGKLTVVIPFYNMGKYISETVSAILGSSYTNREIIIVNDGSSEQQSLEAIDRYRSVPGVRVVDQENGGLARARNGGAALADGEFLAFLDSDDTVQREYYNRCISVLDWYSDVHFAGAWVRYFGDSADTWPTFTPEPPLILFHNVTNSSGLVYRRSSFMAAGLNRENMAFTGLEDYDSVVGMIESGYNGVMIPEVLFNYRVRNDSMIRGISRVNKLILTDDIAATHSSIFAKFASGLSGLQNANGPGVYLDNPSLDGPVRAVLPFGIKLSSRTVAAIKRSPLLRGVAYKIYKAIKKQNQ